MVVRVELPGVMEKDIGITVTDDVLTITGRREEQSEMTDQGGYLVRESFRGSFERSMSLPAGRSDARAADAPHRVAVRRAEGVGGGALARPLPTRRRARRAVAGPFCLPPCRCAATSP